VSALVVNRLFPNFSPDLPPPGDAPRAQYPGELAGTFSTGPVAYYELRRNLEDFLVVAGREQRYVEDLAGEVAPAPVVKVPFLEEDVHDLEGLRIVARHLLGDN
jgi:hypothetical protein